MKQYNLKGEEYPTGISIVDLTSENDCSLQKCSDKRIKRLVAEGVRANVSDDSTLQIAMTLDSGIKLRTCEKLDSTVMQKLEKNDRSVRFSGDGCDGCRILDYDYSIGENYIAKLNKIEEL